MSTEITRALELATEAFAEARSPGLTPEVKRILARLPSADLVEVMDAISPIAANNNENNNSMPIDTPSATELSRDTILDSLSTVPTGRIRAFLVQEGVLQK